VSDVPTVNEIVRDPGPAANERRYAGLPRRLGAIVIDVLIAYVAFSIALAVLVPGALDETTTSHQRTSVGLIALAVLTVLFNYVVFAEWRWGRTLGKLVLRIRVADQDGGTVSWNRALLRNLLLVVDLVVGWVLIPLSPRKQRLGDRLAHTVVVVGSEPVEASADAAVVAVSIPPPPPADEGLEAPAQSVGQPLPPPAEEPRESWGPGRVAGGIGVLLLATLVEVGIVSAFDPDLTSLGARLVLQASLAVTLVAVALFMTRNAGGGLEEPGALGLRRPLRSPYRIAGAAYLAYIVSALVYSAFIHPHQEDVTRDLGFGHGPLGTITAGFLIIVAAPISEETFFRGFIFGGLRHRFSFPAAGLGSAAIFGLFHYTGAGSFGVLPQLAFLGFALAWVYEETGSIYPTMAIHAFNNALAFALLTS
jgi:uncharacterized protein